MRLVKQSVLFFKEGNSDKTYEIDLCDVGGERFVVNFRYGKRGAQLKEGSKTPSPVSLAEAQKIFDAVETEKLEKGYTTNAVGISAIPSRTFTLENIPAFSTGWMNEPAGRNKAILQRLHNAATGGNNTVRAQWKLSRVIWKAGEYKIAEAVPFIAQLFNNADAMQQYCCCWALAKTGNPQAAPALQTIYQSHPSPRLSRLAGVGLLNVLTGLEKEQHLLHYINALPEDFKAAINNQHITEIQNLAAERISQLHTSYNWLEQLYLISTEKKWLRPVVKQLLLQVALKPGYFKHIRVIFKWAELLGDFEIVGLLSCRFEREPELFSHYLSALQRQNIKTYISEVDASLKLSAEFAKSNSRIAFSNKTRWYLHRRTLRRLQMLGEIANTDYVRLATAILISYNRKTDEIEFYSEFGYVWRNNKYERTETRFPSNAQAVYLHQVLSGDHAKLKLVAGQRWQIVNERETAAPKNKSADNNKGGLLKMLTGLFSKKKPQEVAAPIPEPVVNETGTPFLELWNQLPQAYVQLLMDAQMEEVHAFAKNYLSKHPQYQDIIDKLQLQDLKKLLDAPYAIPAAFGYDVVEKKYSEPARDAGLLVSMLNSIHEPAREKGKRWAEASSASLLEDSYFIVSLLFAQHDDTRSWFRGLISGKAISTDLQKTVMGRALALLQAYNPENTVEPQVIKEGTTALFEICRDEIETLDARVLSDLLRHPLPEVLLFGLRILAGRKTNMHLQDLPGAFINDLLQHSYQPVRAEGIAILQQQPADALEKRAAVLLDACISDYEDVRTGIVPSIEKLLLADPSFGVKATTELMPFLLRKEKTEGLHQDVSRLLCNQLSGYLQNANKQTALNLLYSNFAAAQNVGVVILEKYTQPSQLSLPQVIALGSHENLNVREWCWRFYENETARIKYEKEAAVRLLESKWDDTRDFAKRFFREKFEEKDWDADTLISLADSVKPDVEAFARELITRYFQSDNGAVYLQKLSQHPREKMQLFVTNYMERYASDNLHGLKELEFYFRSILTRVNKGRIAKNRVFSFLLAEGKKSEAAAQLVNGIISHISATVAIEDKARCIDILLQLKSVYAVDTPLEILPVTNRVYNH